MSQSSEEKQKRNYRLFFGLAIPKDFWEQIGRYRSDVALNDLRWTKDSNLHITTLFIGNVFPAEAMQLKAIKPAPLPPFQVDVLNVEVKNRKDGLMWAKCNAGPEINALHSYLKEETSKIINLQEENRSYNPHLTLARSRHKIPLENIPEFSPFSFMADHYFLYRSVNGKNGLEYLEIERYPLK